MNQRIKMNKIRESLRLWELKNSYRKIAEILGISRNTVKSYIRNFASKNISYKDIHGLSDDELEEIIAEQSLEPNRNTRYINLLNKFPYFSTELKKTGVTLQLLWEEYKREEEKGYGYSQFCNHYHNWRNESEVTMHIEHKYGDKMFVDFTGDKMKILNPQTGIEKEVEMFVSILGGSQMTYAKATESQKKEDFIKACEDSLLYFEGVPAAIVPDCLKSAVTKGNKYEPDINPDYEHFARHYNTVILPARPYHPKDKALVENAVKIIYMRIFAPLRNLIFTSIDELNEAIKVQLEKHNNMKMQRTNVSRKELFECSEKSLLNPLPAQRYEFKKFAMGTVQINYHVYLREDGHYYSVPYRLKGRKISIAYNERSVELFFKNERVAIHERRRLHGYSTKKEHMPQHHKFYAEWNPERILSWATDIGENVRVVSDYIMNNCKYPEQGFKSCVGIIGLSKKYSKERVNNACNIAISHKEYTYKFVNNLLAKGMDKVKMEQDELPFDLPAHENIRGTKYYSGE